MNKLHLSALILIAIGIFGMTILLSAQIILFKESLDIELDQQKTNLNNTVYKLLQLIIEKEVDSFFNNSRRTDISISGPELIVSAIPKNRDELTDEEIFKYIDSGLVIYIGENSGTPFIFLLDEHLLYDILLLKSIHSFTSDYIFSFSDVESASINEIFLEKSSRKIFHSIVLPFLIDSSQNENDITNKSMGFDSGSLSKRQLNLYYWDKKSQKILEYKWNLKSVLLIVIICIMSILNYVVIMFLFIKEHKKRLFEHIFISSVSHELYTPVAIIKTAMENIYSGYADDVEKVNRYGKLILREIDRLSTLIDSVLYVSRLKMTDKNHSAKTTVNLSETIDSIVCSFKSVFPGQEIEFRTNNIDFNISLDVDGFYIVIENLIKNASIHSHSTSIRIVLNVQSGAKFEITVEDDGIGIPKKEQKRIFKPFYRGTASIMNQVKGTGLGLFIVKETVQNMGLILKFESPYTDKHGVCNTGCRFKILYRGDLDLHDGTFAHRR